MIYNNVLEAMGHTPMIRLNRMNDENSAQVLVKYEGLNIGGSIKTRTAFNMIEEAEKQGKLTKDSVKMCIRDSGRAVPEIPAQTGIFLRIYPGGGKFSAAFDRYKAAAPARAQAVSGGLAAAVLRVYRKRDTRRKKSEFQSVYRSQMQLGA